PLLVGLSALGFRSARDDLRPAIPVGEGEAQHPRRHRSAAVQIAAAQREAAREPQTVRQSRRRGLEPLVQMPLASRITPGGEFVFAVGWCCERLRAETARYQAAAATPCARRWIRSSIDLNTATMSSSGTIWITPSAATAP